MSNILKGLKKVDGKKTGIFAAGVLFGTAGIKVLSSKDAKKLYTNCTAWARILPLISCLITNFMYIFLLSLLSSFPAYLAVNHLLLILLQITSQ